jgi:serine/threonine protein kinase
MVVAGYRLERQLGQGGMGVVYQATQLSLDRTVALKIVAPGLSSDIGFRARFRREGLVQARLDHPNIVTVYEAGEADEVLFLAMRLVRGPSLKDMIITRELDPARSLSILGFVADALDSAHEVGLIHRDVKPHNILVGPKDHPYLADFGLTKGPEDTGLTRTGQFMGSLDYISPEQIRGEAATTASDIYSFGAVLFECLAGVVPYPKESDAAVLYAHVAEPPPQVSDHRSALPSALDAVLGRAMAKEPGERPGSASELVREAERVFRDLTLEEIDVPEPVADPTEIGIRPPELAVDTIESHATVSEELALLAAARPKPPLIRSEEDGALGAFGSPTIPSSAAPSRPRIRGYALGFGAAIGLLAAGGFAAGHSGSKQHTVTAPSRALKAGHVELTVPVAWQPPTTTPTVPGLSFLDETAEQKGASGGALLAGTLKGASGRNLLPPDFLARLPHAPSTSDRVQLAGASAYRYRGLAVRGLSQPLTLFVAPSDAGVVSVACLPPPVQPAAFLASCEHAASTLHLVRARALPLGPEPAYAGTLSKAVAGLRGGESSERSLARARTAAGQATLASRLSAIQTTAAGMLAASKPGPDAAELNGRLVAALRGAASGYRELGRAANAADRKAYDTARASTTRQLTVVRQTIAELRGIGYGA